MSRPEPPPTTTSRPTVTPPPIGRTPFILLGLLTAATVGGPLAIVLTLRGGSRPEWPPDRPVEWWTFRGTVAGYLVLLAACLLLGLYRWRRTVAALRARQASSSEAGAAQRPSPALRAPSPGGRGGAR
jgi:hypothetical protein